MRTVIILVAFVAVAASAQLKTSRCVFVEKTSGRVPPNTILYPRTPPASVVLYPPPTPTCFTNGVYVYKTAPDYRPVTNNVEFHSFWETNRMTEVCFWPVLYEGTNRFECNSSGIYVCGDDTLELAYTNIVVTETEGFQTKHPTKKIAASWPGEEKDCLAVDGYKANTNLLSGSELEAKGIKILFKEVLSIEMVETNGVLREMVVSRWVPCSEAPRKPVAELMGL